ncbi:MAG: hypothetical protein WAO91_08460 [Candidatus Nitrosotenuis sp.]
MKLVAILLIVGLILASHDAFSQTKNKLTVSYSDNSVEPYELELDSDKTHSLSQDYSWIRDDFSRYNLVGYSIDGGEMVQIERNPRGDFSIDIKMDKDRSVRFFSVVQFPLVPTGISQYKFEPESPTSDEWFDAGTEAKIVFSGVIPTSDDTRQVILRWVLDNSEVHLIKEGAPEMSTSTVRMADSHKIEFFSKTQYRVDVFSDFGQPYGSGWYDKGSLTSFGVKTDGVFGNTFEGWEGQGVEIAENPAAILVDSPKKITARWSADYSVIAAPVIIGVAAVVVVIYMKRPKTAKTQKSQENLAFAKISEASDLYDSEIAKFLESKAIDELDSYLSAGLVDQERHSRLKQVISKNQ